MLHAVALVALLGAGCEGNQIGGPGERLYRIRSEADSAVSFRIVVEAPEAIEEAERLLRTGQARWVVGRLRRGDGGYNAPWSWHLDSSDPAGIHFPEVTIEECQATPGYVEQHLEDWLSRSGLTCFGGRVVERLD
jgi:hypothetical protein